MLEINLHRRWESDSLLPAVAEVEAEEAAVEAAVEVEVILVH
jgi:hypothetical protein